MNFKSQISILKFQISNRLPGRAQARVSDFEFRVSPYMANASALIAVLAAALLFSSCGAARPTSFYSLEVPAAPAAAGGAHNASLLVGRFTAPHVYRDNRIVYRMSNTQLGAYEYHRWAEPPTEMLEALTVRLLRTSGKYTSVQSLGSNARGDYILRGRLHSFEEVSGVSSLTARVTLEAELYDPATGTVVWSHFYTHDEPVNAKTVPAVVEALNRNARAGLEEITRSLDAWFTQRGPKGPEGFTQNPKK